VLFTVSQVESSVRLLQLVSVVAEAAGERLQPHLGALAAALPQVCLVFIPGLKAWTFVLQVLQRVGIFRAA
jgi:hypothetical protein